MQVFRAWTLQQNAMTGGRCRSVQMKAVIVDRPFMHQKKCGRRQNLAETPYSIVEHIIAIKARCCGVSPHRTCCTLFGGCEQLFIILSLLEPTGLSVKAPETADPGLEGESIPSKTAAYAALHSSCYK